METGVEAGRSRLRLPRPRSDVVRGLRRVADEPRRQLLGVANVERTRRIRPAEPLLRAHRVEVRLGCVDVDRTGGLSTVDKNRNPGRLPQLLPREYLPVEPRDSRERDQLGTRRHLT